MYIHRSMMKDTTNQREWIEKEKRKKEKNKQQRQKAKTKGKKQKQSCVYTMITCCDEDIKIKSNPDGDKR